MVTVTHCRINDHKTSKIDIELDNIKASFLSYGATLYNLETKDKNNQFESIVLQYKNLDDYDHNPMYLNSIVGPVAGRLKDATFQIDNTTYIVDKNYKETESLHSGIDSVSFKEFDYKTTVLKDSVRIMFTHISNNEYFPGQTEIRVVYTLKDSTLTIEYYGKTNKPTLLNLTNHAYFNLSGNAKSNINQDILMINADRKCQLGDKEIPLSIIDIKNTNYDFNKPSQINDFVIDDPYILNNQDIAHKNITLYNKETGRLLEMYTDYPCTVVYTHNYPDSVPLKHHDKVVKHYAICLEAQNTPNGVNIPGVEKSILRPNEIYHQKTIYKFTVKEGLYD